jgi:hypothetical protein
MAENESKQISCVVYWLFNESCVCPWRHGCIGYSTDWETRLKNHRRNPRFPLGFSWKFLFRGTVEECRKLEGQMRPAKKIGWNLAVGGGKNRLGIPHNAEARRKMSEAIRPPISDETKEKLRITSAGRTNKGRIGQKKSDKEKAKISASQTGKKRSDAAKAKLSARMIGKKYHLGFVHSEETKERIRMKKIGVPVHSDEEKRRRSERWKGNSLTKGKPWSAARRLAWLNSKQEEA